MTETEKAWILGSGYRISSLVLSSKISVNWVRNFIYILKLSGFFFFNVEHMNNRYTSQSYDDN